MEASKENAFKLTASGWKAAAAEHERVPEGMIDYQKGFLGLPSFLYWYGSVVPRSLVPAVVSASATVAIKWSATKGEEDETEDGEPAYGAAMTALNWIVGFLLVYRAQQSYARCAVLYAAIF